MGEGRVYVVAIAITDNDVIVLLFNQFIFVMTHKHLSDEILGKVSSFGWVHTLRFIQFVLSTTLSS